MQQEEKVLTVEELATFLNCSTSLVRKLIKTQQIPFIKIGRSIRLEKKQVLTALNRKANI